MDPVMVKGKPLSKDETRALLKLIEGCEIITTKTTSGATNKSKAVEWNRITERFNSTVANCRRTPQQLRLKWENLKKNARRLRKIRTHQLQTGEYVPPDEILDRVNRLLGSTASGIVPYGGDREEFVVVDGGDSSSGSGGSSGSDASCGSYGSSGRMGGNTRSNLNTTLEFVDGNMEKAAVQHNTSFHTPERSRTLNMPRASAFRRKQLTKPDDGRIQRNLAIAGYYISKKKIVDTKFENIKLQNEKLKLEIAELKKRQVSDLT